MAVYERVYWWFLYDGTHWGPYNSEREALKYYKDYVGSEVWKAPNATSTLLGK